MELEKLLYLQGVGAEFIDCFGNLVHIPAKDRQGILTTMLLPSSGHQHAFSRHSEALCHLNESYHQPLSESQVAAKISQLDIQPWLKPLHNFQWCLIDKPHVDIYLPERDSGALASRSTVKMHTLSRSLHRSMTVLLSVNTILTVSVIVSIAYFLFTLVCS